MFVVLARSRSSLILLFLLLPFPISTADPTYLYSICSNTTTFTPKSKFKSNLNTLFHSLSSNATVASRAGFYASAAGYGTTDVVYGLFLCRGDQNVTACSDCVNTATATDLPKTYCPDRKVAVIWYDECMVRYSDEPIYGIMDEAPKLFVANTQNINGSQAKFTEILSLAVSASANLIELAATTGKKYATEVVEFTNFETLYVMAQCTPDLTSNDCNRCLTLANRLLVVRQGARVLMPSCFVRYETYPFYDGVVNLKMSFPQPPSLSPQSLPLSPPPPPFIVHANSSGESPVNSEKTHKSPTKVALSVMAILIVVITVGICVYRKKAKTKSRRNAENGLDDLTTDECLLFELDTLQVATNNFCDAQKLGVGGFGAVYKGVLSNGQEIAVKRLSTSSGQGAKEFKNEIVLVAKLQHRNLVRLLGYCLAREEKLLVYEFVPNKSLNYFLFDPEKNGELNWARRYNIIKGIARGMLYLHEDSRPRIIHRDLKTANVLLDADMNPKIADFGMARIFAIEQIEDNTNRVVGTYGYMAPEYAMHGLFSVKSDVYSFGVIVLEIVSGKKIRVVHQSNGDDLLTNAWKCWRENRPLEFMDPILRDSCSNDEVRRCIHLALLCLEEDVELRPTMATIVLTLNTYSTTTTIAVPQRPSFVDSSTNSTYVSRSDQFSTVTTSTSNSTTWSKNEASITELLPR